MFCYNNTLQGLVPSALGLPKRGLEKEMGQQPPKVRLSDTLQVVIKRVCYVTSGEKGASEGEHHDHIFFFFFLLGEAQFSRSPR